MNHQRKQNRSRSLREIAEKAVLPFRILERLEIPFGYERSFKMSRGQLLANRFLLGVSLTDTTPPTLFDICYQLGMPARLFEPFQQNLPEANLVFFGFEDDEVDGNYRVYLEYWDKICAEISAEPEKIHPRLMFLGYKWNTERPQSQAISRYHCYPLLSTSEILERISDVYAQRQQACSLAYVREMVHRAASECLDRSFIYLEVTEEENVRTSFDLNLYKSGLCLHDIHGILVGLQQHYEIRQQDFEKLFQLVGSKLLGHISGGTNRQGEEFLTVYYANDL